MSPTQQRKSTTSVPRPRRSAEKTTAGAKKAATKEAQKKAQNAEMRAAPERSDGGMVLPVVNVRVPRPPRPHLGLPPAGSMPGRVLWLGGLGTLAVVGALDWPVAVAIAAGTWVAEQRARERLRAEQAAHTGPDIGANA